MKALSKQETIEALKQLFDYKAHKDSREVMVIEENGNASFMIDKRYMERYEVINILLRHFTENYIEGGQCRLDNITLVWTTFHIEDRA